MSITRVCNKLVKYLVKITIYQGPGGPAWKITPEWNYIPQSITIESCKGMSVVKIQPRKNLQAIIV